MPPTDQPAGPVVRASLAMRHFFQRHRRAFKTAWDLAPNATVVSTAVSIIVMMNNMDR